MELIQNQQRLQHQYTAGWTTATCRHYTIIYSLCTYWLPLYMVCPMHVLWNFLVSTFLLFSFVFFSLLLFRFSFGVGRRSSLCLCCSRNMAIRIRWSRLPHRKRTKHSHDRRHPFACGEVVKIHPKIVQSVQWRQRTVKVSSFESIKSV